MVVSCVDVGVDFLESINLLLLPAMTGATTIAAQLEPRRPHHTGWPEQERKFGRTAHSEVIALGCNARCEVVPVVKEK